MIYLISEENIQKYYKDLSGYLPDFFKELPEQQVIMDLNSREIARVKFLFEDVLNQFNVETATWGLRIYEDYYLIPYNPSISYEERRKTIKSYMMSKGPTTSELIKKIASIYAEEVEVIRHDAESWLDIILQTSSGFDDFIEKLMQKIKIIVPGHIGTHFTLVSKEIFKDTIYAGCALVSTLHYTLTNDFAVDYEAKAENKVCTAAIDTKIYTLTNDFSINYNSKSENNNASVIISTQRYTLK